MKTGSRLKTFRIRVTWETEPPFDTPPIQEREFDINAINHYVARKKALVYARKHFEGFPSETGERATSVEGWRIDETNFYSDHQKSTKSKLTTL